MKKLYYLWQFMKGNRALYIISIAAIGMATFLSFFWPMVLRVTVDSIIGGKALEAQGWLKPVFSSAYDFLGGRSGLASKLWICSILLIVITLLRGIFLYFKGKWSAIVDEYGDITKSKKENWPESDGNIRFKDVSFGYKDGEYVLDDFNLEVQAGETIALVGETGSGKSTIVNLACRFYEPTKGEVLIDGVDYRKRSMLWLHSSLGYVLQTPHLFSGTIKENIAYGCLTASDNEINEAAKLVNAHEFITGLEKGYDSEVGEGGSLLSTSEKQLIYFARAIITGPKIFVLDEATSSVDTETEKKIQDATHKVLEDRTSFIIAHRLSTIRSADRIIVVQKGKITEMGTHHELLKLKGYYYRLYSNQFMEEQESELLTA